MFKSIHPFDQSVIETFPTMNSAAVGVKIGLASKAFQDWRKTSITERSKLMFKVASIIREKKDEYARTITLEMGKLLSEAKAEVEKSATACEYFADHAEQFLKDQAIPTEAKNSFVAFQPIGAVLAIMPWNFPFWQVFRFAAPALMAGNVGLLKHAPNVTRCSLMIENLFLDAGFPSGVFQSLVVEVNQVEQIIAEKISSCLIINSPSLAFTSTKAFSSL